MPSWWYAPAAAVPWGVTLHSVLAAAVLFLWARRLRLAPGRTRRALLGLILLLPLLTATVPGRYGFDFRESWAWFDSARLLAVPVLGGLHLYHGVLVVAAATVLVSLRQELVPLLKLHRPAGVEPPPELVRRVRSLPGWEGCRVEITDDEGLFASTGGRPSSPRLWLSREVLELPPEQLEAVLRHELAHWRRGWWVPHLLYAARLLQIYNPVALWAFREYTVETEIACDADAVAGRDPRPLARVLLQLYEESHGSAARSLLRRRVDLLLGRAEPGEALPPEAVPVAGALLLGILPWIV